jgi:ABC-2 type transport system ATP-binding protein
MPLDTSPSVIETVELRKVYDRTVAVRGLTLSVGRGEVFGFLGPNGAGKTTTIKMLLGLAQPTAGRALVLGRRPGDPAVMGRIGFLPEHFRFPSWLRAADFLDFHARLYNLGPSERRRRIPELFELVGLVGHEETRLGQYSKGMSQRIGLAQALLNRPELVILDEPTSGLDPLGRRHVMEIIRGLRGDGATVFLNSHLLSEVEATCDRVAVIKEGRVARTGTLDELAERRLEVEVRAEGITEEAVGRLSAWAQLLRRDGDTLMLAVGDRADLPRIAASLVQSGAALYSFASHRPSLEELFVRIIEEEP